MIAGSLPHTRAFVEVRGGQPLTITAEKLMGFVSALLTIALWTVALWTDPGPGSIIAAAALTIIAAVAGVLMALK
jgi:hypothetical protein